MNKDKGLRVATYNVHEWVGADGRFDPWRTLKVLHALDADVLALQEVSFCRGRGFSLDDLSQTLEMNVVEGMTLTRRDAPYGNLFLSRLPVLRVRRRDLSWGRREPRGLLDVELAASDGARRFMATHLGLGLVERGWQLDRVNRLLKEEGAPLALLADLNEWLPWRPAMRALLRRFGGTAPRRSFPSRWPTVSLDAVLCHPRHLLRRPRARFDPPEVRVASDHLPVLAVLRTRGDRK